MGRVGDNLVSYLLSHGQYKVYFFPSDSDYMAGRWRKEIKNIIIRKPEDLEIDQSIDFCSVLNARRPKFSRLRTTWFYYELSSVPRKVVEDINSNDQIYVTSSFVARIFSDHGVVAPTTVLGHGFDPKRYRYAARSRDREFIFLCVAEHSPRKNLPFLVECFERAFQDTKDVRLVLKLGLLGEGDIRRYISQPDKVSIYGRRSLSEAKLAGLYESAHCFVLPTRAEGFGLPILEAMATGLPVIVTNYSGHLDFCTTENSFLIHNKGLVDSDPECFPNFRSQWGDPDPEHLVSLLRYVYRNYDRALAVGQRGCKAAHEGWTWKTQLRRAFP
jgi:glycosyltransferase involved in cell wall biosynthesis